MTRHIRVTSYGNKAGTRIVVETVSAKSIIYPCAYVLLWVTTLLSLWRWQHFEIGDALTAFVVLALVLPAVAMLATRGTTPLPHPVRRPKPETAALLLYLVVVALLLVIGFGRIVQVTVEPWHSVAILGLKLLIFVIIPGAMIWLVGGYHLGEPTLLSIQPRTLQPALWMSLAVLIMQSFLGRGLQDIRAAHLPVWVIAVATPLSFLWLVFEVGLVEEFFFRVLLQERLAAALKSPWAGLVVSAVLFGLVHAPGFYLRSASSMEGFGAHPSIFAAVGYSIVMTSLAGLVLGVLWMRTRNLVVLMIVHAAFDVLSNLVPWVKVFHLA